MINLTSIISKNSEIVTAEMDGEKVMLHIESGKYFNLGKSGGAIWDLLEDKMSVGILIDKLVDRYDVSKEQCTEETIAFLESTVNAGIVTIID